MSDILLDPLGGADQRTRFDERPGVGIGCPSAGLTGGIEKREELIILPLRDRVILVIMTLRALHGEPHEHGRHSINLIRSVGHAILFSDCSAFVGIHAVAQKPGCHPLLLSRLGKKIAGNLLHCKLIKRFVVEKGVNDPVPPDPHVTVIIDRIAIRVRITRAIEPVHREAFSRSG